MKNNNNDWLSDALDEFLMHKSPAWYQAREAIKSAIKERLPKAKSLNDKSIKASRIPGYNQAIKDTLKALGIEDAPMA